MADLGNTEPKSWDLTEEEKIPVEEGYEEIRNNQQKQDNEQELFEEELDKVIAGNPIIDDDEYSK